MSTGLRWSIIGGLGLLLCTPLLVANSLFFPFITGKAFFFRTIVELVFACWLVLIAIDKNYRPRRSLLLWVVLGFMAVLAAAALFGINSYRSFWSNFERMEGLVTYFHLLALFLVASTVINTEKWWQWLFRLSVGVSVVVMYKGMCQLLGKCAITQGGVRLDATFGNATYLAVYMLIHFFITAWLLHQDWSKVWTRFVYIPLLGLQAFILYHTATRGAILGFLAGLIVAATVVAWRGRGRARKFSLAALALVVVLIGGVWFGRHSSFIQKSPVLSRFATISTTEVTTESRLTIWGMALQGFKERPILGWGPENFLQVFSKYYEPKLWRQEPWFDHSHNIYLDWLVHAGVLGLSGYLALFAITFYYLWRREKNYVVTALFSGLLVGYAINNFFVFDNLVSYILFFLLLAYCAHRYERGEQKLIPVTVSWPLPPAQNVTVGAVLVLLVFTLYQVVWRPYNVGHTLLLALQNNPNNSNDPRFTPEARLGYFKEVLAAETFGSAEAVNQLFGQAWSAAQSPNVQPQTKQEYINVAINAAKEQIAAQPDDVRTMYTLGSLFLGLNQPQEALKYFLGAEKLSPRKQTIIMDTALAYLATGDKATALATAKRGYELDTNFPSARLAYSLVLLKTGQTKQAEEIIGDLVLDERFINVYAEIGNYKKVLELWQQKVATDPNNPQLYISLAAAYFANGNNTASIRELNKAIQLSTDAQFKAEAQELIRRIQAGENPLAQ